MRWLVCCAATTAALNPRIVVAASLRASAGCQRTRKLVAQYPPQQGQNGYTQQELPAGWTMAFDQASGAYYYCNEQSGQCQWEPPQPNLPGTGGGTPVRKSLPAGWTLEVDQASGTEYYCNAQSGQCQWEPPQPNVPRGDCEASKRGGYVEQHSRYDPRSATETYEQWLAKQGY
jgi:uncharacterized protein YbdZ (MbtH family)